MSSTKVKDLVEAAIADNTITIFSKSWCPYSKRAKELLTREFPDTKTGILEIDKLPEEQEIQDYLLERSGQRTVPNVFINQKHVGGSDRVKELHEQGALVGLVSA